MTHVSMILGFVIWLGVAGRFDCDAAMGVSSPNMIPWMLAGFALMIPEIVWFLRIMMKIKEMERDETNK